MSIFEQKASDVLLVPEKPSQSEEMASRVAVLSTALNSDDDEAEINPLDSLFNNYTEAQKDAESTARASLLRNNELEAQDAVQLVSNGEASPEVARQFMLANIDLSNAIERTQDPIELQLIKVADAGRAADNPLDQRELFSLYATLKVAQLQENRSTFGKSIDFLGGFLPDRVFDKAALERSTGNTLDVIRSMRFDDAIPAFDEFLTRMLDIYDNNPSKVAEELSIMMRSGSDEGIRGEQIFWDMVDALAFVPGVAAVNAVSKTAGAIRNAAALKRLSEASNGAALLARIDKKKGAVLLDEAIRDTTGKVATAAGISREGAAASAVGGRAAYIFQGDAAAGVSSDILHAARTRVETVQAVLDNAKEIALKNKVSLVDEEVLAKKLQESVKEAKIKSELIDPDGKNIVAHEVTTRRTSPGQYDVDISISEGPLAGVTKSISVRLEADDLVKSFEFNVDKLTQFTSSAEKVFREKLSDLVGTATVATVQQDAFLARLGTAYSQALKGLSARQVRKNSPLQLYLAKGNTDSKVYSIAELQTGDVIKGIRGLDDKEVAAYYSVRQIYDELYNLYDETLVRQVTTDGYKAVKGIGTKGGKAEEFIAKPITRVTGTVRRMLDLESGSGIDLSSALKKVKDMPDQYQLVKFVTPHRRKGPKTYEYEYGIVPKSNIGEAPQTVLQYRQGYVPQITKNARYVGMEVTETVRNGVRNPRGYILTHVFDSDTDARLWRETMQANGKETVVGTRDELLRQAGGESSEQLAARKAALQTLDSPWEMNSIGGLYSGERATRPIYYSSENLSREFVAPLEALQRNMSYVGHTYPINEFRMQLIKQFEKVAGKSLSDPSNWNSPLLRSSSDDRHINGLQFMQDYIRTIMRMPTQSENAASSILNGVARTFEGVPIAGGVVSKGIYSAADYPLASKLKAGAYHGLLGMGNFSQLVVQAFGASVALSLHPIRGAGAMRQFMSMQLARIPFIKNDPKAIAAIAKGTGMSTDDFVRLMDDWEQSGILQSLRSNADLNVSEANAFFSRGAINSLLEAGTLPVRGGENFTRTVSWLIARSKKMDELRDAGRAATAADMADVLKESYRLSLNLSRANKATWQSGFVSIPTQFYQITAKWWSEVVLGAVGRPSSFTRAETYKILGTSLGLYGAYAVPFGPEKIVPGLLSMMGVEPGELDEKTLTLARGGLVDLTTAAIFGVPLEISSRTSMAAGVSSIYKSWVEEGNIHEVLSAASGVLPQRFIEAMRVVVPVTSTSLKEAKFTVEDAAIVLKEVSGLATGPRSMVDAYMMLKLNQMIARSDGAVIMEVGPNLSLSEFKKIAVAKGLGITSGRVRSFYETSAEAAKDRKALNESSKTASRYISSLLAISAQDGKSPEEIKEVMKKASVFLKIATSGMSKEESDSFLRTAYGRIADDPKELRLIEDVARNSFPYDKQVLSNTVSDTLRPAQED